MIREVPISPKFFASWLTEGNEICAKCTKGLPDDAKFQRFYQEGDVLIMVFEHSGPDETVRKVCNFESQVWEDEESCECGPVMVTPEGVTLGYQFEE